jgi:hypothetical protein
MEETPSEKPAFPATETVFEQGLGCRQWTAD